MRSVRRTGRSHTDHGYGATFEMPARILRRAQRTFPNSTFYKLIETGLRDRRLTRIDDRHFFIADIDAHDIMALFGKASGRSHADVAKPKHCNFHWFITIIATIIAFAPATIALRRARQVRAKGLPPGLSGYPIGSTPLMKASGGVTEPDQILQSLAESTSFT